MKKKCINEEVMMDFIEGRLTGKKRQKIEHHLAECESCFEEITLVAEMMRDKELFNSDQTELESVPEHVTKKTVSAVHGIKEESLADTISGMIRPAVSKCADELTNLFATKEPALATVRGLKETVSDELVRIKKSLGQFEIDLEIEKKEEKIALIRIEQSEKKTVTEPVRITLLRDKREVSSLLMSDTPIVFDNVSFGPYTMVFFQNGKLVGELFFEIK